MSRFKVARDEVCLQAASVEVLQDNHSVLLLTEMEALTLGLDLISRSGIVAWATKLGPEGVLVFTDRLHASIDAILADLTPPPPPDDPSGLH